jgi:hypothetical protein
VCGGGGGVRGEGSREATVVGRDVGDVPEEAFEPPVDGAQDEEVVEKGAQEHGLERHLELGLPSPADVVDEQIPQEGPKEEEELDNDELRDEASGEDDDAERDVHHLHEDDFVFPQAVEAESDVR